MILWIVSVLILCSMPLIPAVTIQQVHHEVERETEKIDSFFGLNVDSSNIFSTDSSFLLRLFVLVEILSTMIFSLWLLNILELKLIEVAIELSLGVFVTFLLMLLTATIPVKLLNGVCLLAQKQLGWGKWKTGFITVSVLFSWIILHLLQLRRIDWMYHQNI